MSELNNAGFEARLAMAKDELTLSDVLAQLARDSEAQIRQATASNPNTPIAVLSQLGAEFPEEVIENPICKKWLLEAPKSRFVRLCLARSASTGGETLAKLSCSNDKAVILAIAGNPNTPFYILEEFVDKPPEVCRHSNGRRENLFMAMARNPATPAEIVEKLAGESSIKIREILKQHPNVSSMALAIAKLVENSNSETSIEVLERLADDKRPSLRQIVAAHPKTPTSLLEKLVRNADEIADYINQDVSATAARHPHANSSILELYAELLVAQLPKIYYYTQYEDSAITLLAHPQLTPKVLEKFVDLGLSRLTSAIASFAKTPPNLLLKLTEMKSPLADIALWNKLASNPNTPSEALEKLFSLIGQSKNPTAVDGLISIAVHHHTPLSVIEQLSMHPESSVRRAAYQNPTIRSIADNSDSQRG